MANVLVEETHLTNIANAIRNQNGTTTTYKPGEMADAISAITTAEDLDSELDEYESGLTTQETTIDDILAALEDKASSGDTSEIEDAFIAKTLSGAYVNDRVTTVGIGAMAGQKITSASFPNATLVDEKGFSVSNSLETVDLPKATYLGNSAFYSCLGLKSIYAPAVLNTSSSVFRNCVLLEEISLPIVNTMSTYIFYGCNSLKKADLGNIKSLGAYSLYKCTSLEKLILRKTDAVCTLANTTNVFTDTPIANGTGYVYVPDDLVDSYKAATNWSTYAAQIKPLSELEV